MAVERQRAPSLLERLRDRDHTRGRLLASLLVLSLPSIATSFMGAVVYQLVDLKFIGALGPAPMAAVVVSNQALRQFFFILVMGASFGSQALISRYVGEGDVDAADHVAGQVLFVGGVFSGLLALIGGLFPAQLLGLLDPAPEVLEAGVSYVRLVFLLGFGTVATQLFSAILGGAGDTTTPMVIAVIQSAVAIVAEWVLIFGNLGAPVLGIDGVAIGAGVSSAVGTAIALWALFTGRCRVHVRLHHLAPDAEEVRRLLRLSWPPALQMLSRTVVIFLFLRLSGRFGTPVQAAYSIGLRLEMMPTALAFPIAGACATLVGQSLGNGDVRRAWRSVWTGLAVHASLLWSFAAGIFVFRREIVAYFTSDPEVIAVGSEYLLYAAGSFAFWGVYFIVFRALQGAGAMKACMLISLAGQFAIALPLGHYLALGTDLAQTGIWIANLVASGFTTTVTVAFFATGRWTRIRLGPRG